MGIDMTQVEAYLTATLVEMKASMKRLYNQKLENWGNTPKDREEMYAICVRIKELDGWNREEAQRLCKCWLP
jgi:general stress protein 26